MRRLSIKKAVCGGIAAGLLVFIGSGSFTAFAQTQALRPTNQSYAWLEDVFIREDVSQVRLSPMIALANYPHSRNLSDFQYEMLTYVQEYSKGEAGVLEEVQFIIQQASLLLIGMGVTESYAEQRIWLVENYGIIYPEKDDENTQSYTLILYAILNRGMASTLEESGFLTKPLNIPKNVTLEKAMVMFLSASSLTTVTNPDGKPADSKGAVLNSKNVETMQAFLYELIRYSLKVQGYPVTDETSDEDLMRYFKRMTAEQLGYSVDEEATDTELDTYALISVLKERYGIRIQPGSMAELLFLPTEQAQADALTRLVLETMVLERGGSVQANTPLQTLFDRSLELGYFELGEDFYSDVYSYRIDLSYKRSSVWLTPICYADLMTPPGKREKVSITIGGEEALDRLPFEIALNNQLKQQTVEVRVSYEQGSINEFRTYRFTFVQGEKYPPQGSGNTDVYVKPPQEAVTTKSQVSNIITAPIGGGYTPGEVQGNTGAGLTTTNAYAGAQQGVTNPSAAGGYVSPGFENTPVDFNGEQSPGSSDKAGLAETGLQMWMYAAGGGVLLVAAGGGYYAYNTKQNGKPGAKKKENRF